jgi:hypothetical protein
MLIPDIGGNPVITQADVDNAAQTVALLASCMFGVLLLAIIMVFVMLYRVDRKIELDMVEYEKTLPPTRMTDKEIYQMMMATREPKD